MKFHYSVLVLATIWVSTLGVALADGECSLDNPCQDGFCCSTSGFCGTGADWCDPGHCASQCPPPTPPPPPPAPSPPPPPPSPPAPPSPISDIIDIYLFDELLKHRNDSICEKPGFFTYNAFITAANEYPNFGTTGDTETRKREIAAFFGQTSHETTGGWPNATDGPYAWGYCIITENNPNGCCDETNIEWPCVPGKSYCGRGPIQLTWNYNYGPCGRDIGYNLLTDPDAVTSDAVVSFKTALWFWMTPQDPKPSCHAVITGQWTPTDADREANRLPGYGLITNIINGGIECGKGVNAQQEDRIGFYKKYCDDFGVSYGDNIDCNNQQHYGSGVGLVRDI